MSTPPPRPDPDVLLRRLQEEEARGKRGRLKIFFGFAPGVGKTYRMLQVARDLVSEQGLDVVVGIVETHRRRETAAMMLGLELLPRRTLAHRGRTLEEFDLDAALARKPQVLLVDELAHTNAPGTRHPKRWQDVLELLEAGIDVYTTMNVQHVESLNDVISQITHVQVRETVPDTVVDAAETLELVDISPEELLQRLEEGKVYLPEEARRAAEHFFQRGNLLALRELALRRTAQHVDEDVQEYRERHGVSVAWPTGERILVCVGPAPSSARLIRAAARMAAGLRCPWVAVYVESPAVASLTPEEREGLEVQLRAVESLGGTVTRLSGLKVSETILSYAQRHNVTRIVIGKPTHPSWRDRLRGSLLDEVVRGSGEIDVLVISGDGVEVAPSRAATRASGPGRPGDYLAAAAIVGATLGLALALRAVLGLPDPEMLFLVAVMITALRFGHGPSLLAAALSVGCYDVFFVPPFLTFGVSDERYVLTFAMMFGVGFVLSELTGRLRRQEQDARAREERTAVLYALSRDLASAATLELIAQVAARHSGAAFSARAVVLQAADGGELVVLGAAPPGTNLEAKELGVAKWALTHGAAAGLGTDTLPGSASVCAPLRAGTSVLGVLALLPVRREAMGAEQRDFLEALCRQVAVAIERVRLAEAARASALRAKSEEMRSALLSSVSHELRTPLASITGAATALRDEPALGAKTRGELVGSICDEAQRLERLVSNLLDMVRLESGAMSIRRDWVPLEKIIGSALTRLEDRLGARKLSVGIPDDLPLLLVDPVLLEQLFINLLDNAIRYTPPGSPLEIWARREEEAVTVEVLDRGPGLPPGLEERVFDKFYRAPDAGPSGAGLGLAIGRGIAEAHGGVIRASNREGGGAAFRVTIPTGGVPPSAPLEEGGRK